MASKQTFGRRVVPFHGRRWSVRLIDSRDIDDQSALRTMGSMSPERGLIECRYMAHDQALITLLHELMHIALPNVSEKQIEQGDAILKDSLEAFGVDLSPMLRGYRK